MKKFVLTSIPFEGFGNWTDETQAIHESRQFIESIRVNDAEAAKRWRLYKVEAIEI